VNDAEPGLSAVSIESAQLEATNRLLASLTRVLGGVYRDATPTQIFRELLAELLALTDSEYGYIGEIIYARDSRPYLKTWATRDIAGADELTPGALETLLRQHFHEGTPFIADVPACTASDPHASARTSEIRSYVGVPIRHGEELVGLLNVANRPGGYDESFVDYLRPFVSVLGTLIDAFRLERRRHATAMQLAALVENLHDAVLFVDSDQRVVLANRPFCRIFRIGDEPATLVGRLATEIRRDIGALVVEPGRFLHVVSERREREEPLELHLRDGRVIECDYVPVPISERRQAHLWVYRDVTRRKELEEQRLRLLEREREARAAIEDQNRSLRELTALKSDFVASVSHELRTPLTSIVSFGELLLVEGDRLDDEQREFVEIINRNAQRLLQLVGDLLLLARLESGGLTLQRELVDIPWLVDAAAATIRPLAHAQCLTLVVTTGQGPLLRADPRRLEQVLSNLLSNAVKFTPAGGQISVTAVHPTGAWQIEVSDTGLGIPETDQSRLFQRFVRGSNVTEDAIPGTGLGLAITAAIVELHGGTIAVASSPGRGTTLSVRLPDDGAPPE
jgi:PAS domain S-box-containing protein